MFTFDVHIERRRLVDLEADQSTPNLGIMVPHLCRPKFEPIGRLNQYANTMQETNLFRSSQQHFELINSFEPLCMAPLTQDLVYYKQEDNGPTELRRKWQ